MWEDLKIRLHFQKANCLIKCTQYHLSSFKNTENAINYTYSKIIGISPIYCGNKQLQQSEWLHKTKGFLLLLFMLHVSC